MCTLRERRKNFNPRAPYGARPKYREWQKAQETISIHAPRMGRDVKTKDYATITIEFQSTRPVWGAT